MGVLETRTPGIRPPETRGVGLIQEAALGSGVQFAHVGRSRVSGFSWYTSLMLEAIIDKLTRSIEERATGRALDTEVAPASLMDVEALDEVWLFDWKQEVNQNEVYKLIANEHGARIHGLMSLTRQAGFVFVDLLESNPCNVGRDKQYMGVPGNLFAFAAKLSFELGNGGFVVFVAKTSLIEHYERTLGARRIGSSQRMFLDAATAELLVATYFGER